MPAKNSKRGKNRPTSVDFDVLKPPEPPLIITMKLKKQKTQIKPPKIEKVELKKMSSPPATNHVKVSSSSPFDADLKPPTVREEIPPPFEDNLTQDLLNEIKSTLDVGYDLQKPIVKPPDLLSILPSEREKYEQSSKDYLLAARKFYESELYMLAASNYAFSILCKFLASTPKDAVSYMVSDLKDEIGRPEIENQLPLAAIKLYFKAILLKEKKYLDYTEKWLLEIPKLSPEEEFLIKEAIKRAHALIDNH